MNPQAQTLEQRINDFVSVYGADLSQLAALLNEAGISHYSSGCGSKHITFDLFPAATYVEEIINMLNTEREFKNTLCGGFKDAKGEYNPAQDFILYLRRWQLFAEQAMNKEGESKRGIIAANAKLLLESLYIRLSEGKSGKLLKTASFCKLMEALGTHLMEKEKASRAHLIAAHKQRTQENLRRLITFTGITEEAA
jgi:hypothetical protein